MKEENRKLSVEVSEKQKSDDEVKLLRQAIKYILKNDPVGSKLLNKS